LSLRRPASIGRDDLSIHLADVRSHVRKFDGRILGSSVRDLVPVLLAERKETPSLANETNAEAKNESSMRNASKAVVSSPLQDALQPRRDTNASTAEKIPPTRIQIPTIPDKKPPVLSSTKPLRSVRKAFAKATGLHGAFTKHYKDHSTKSAASPLPKRIPAKGLTPEPRRIPQELVQNPPRRPPHKVLQSLSSQPGDTATAEVRNASQPVNATRQSEPPSSLLKPGLPAFGRKEGASVPPGRRETSNNSLRPPPPPPPTPKLEGTKGSVTGTASPKSPDDASSGAELPATHSRRKGGSSSAAALPQASALAPRQPQAPMSKDGREQQQPPPRPENRPASTSTGRALPDHAASKPPSKENVAGNTADPPGDARGASSSPDPPPAATAAPPSTIKKP
jgi:hypothetical protein